MFTQALINRLFPHAHYVDLAAKDVPPAVYSSPCTREHDYHTSNQWGR